MNKKIVAALASLKIPVAYMEYTGKEQAYIMFQVYNEQDGEFFDDTNEAEISYITMSYWYKNPADKSREKEIKSLMKQAGFVFDGSKDMKDEGFYGRSFDFIYKEYL